MTESTKAPHLIRIAAVLSDDDRTLEDIRHAFAGRPIEQLIALWNDNTVSQCVEACSVIDAGIRQGTAGDHPMGDVSLPVEQASQLELCMNSRKSTTNAIVQEASRQINQLFDRVYVELREHRVRHFLRLLQATPDEVLRIGSSVIQRGLQDIWVTGATRGFDKNRFETIDDWIGFCVVCSINAWRKAHRKRRVETRSIGPDEDFLADDSLAEINSTFFAIVEAVTESCIGDDTDKVIVRMTIDGANYAQIGRIVDLNPGNVSRRWKKIVECVNSRMGQR